MWKQWDWQTNIQKEETKTTHNNLGMKDDLRFMVVWMLLVFMQILILSMLLNFDFRHVYACMYVWLAGNVVTVDAYINLYYGRY